MSAEEIHDDDMTEDATGSVGTEADSNDVLKLQAERDDLFNKLARAQAEFQNSRRRLEADKEQAVQYANSSLIKALLPVIDNFERALSVDPTKSDVGTLLKGMHIVHDQWLAELAKQTVAVLAPKVGDGFDPNTMQALMQQPSELPENQVTQLLQKGYTMHGRTLRPAQVAVSKGK